MKASNSSTTDRLSVREIEYEPEETTPLLRNNSNLPPGTQNGKGYLPALYIIFILIILTDLSEYIIRAPLQRVIESVLCKYYFQEHDPSMIGPDGEVPEPSCKIASVQQDLAKLNGWLNFIDGIPGR
jgi:hypothetical protein